MHSHKYHRGSCPRPLDEDYEYDEEVSLEWYFEAIVSCLETQTKDKLFLYVNMKNVSVCEYQEAVAAAYSPRCIRPQLWQSEEINRSMSVANLQ